MPARIDRSYWGDKLSGSTGTQLMSALRFLDLIDANGFPTAKLRQMVISKGSQRTEIIRQIASESYSFFFDGQMDSQTVTYAQLEESFHDNYQVASDVARKCIKFFIGLAGDGGLKLSPFITKKTRSTRSSYIVKKPGKSSDKKTRIEIPQDDSQIPNGMNLDKLLIDKFPGFDPEWADEIKLKWFAAFDELLRRTSN